MGFLRSRPLDSLTEPGLYCNWPAKGKEIFSTADPAPFGRGNEKNHREERE